MTAKIEYRYKKYIYYPIAAIFLIGLILMLNMRLDRQRYLDRIPTLPRFSDSTGVQAKYIIDAHKLAVSNPASEELIGALAMTYHANSFYKEAEICYLLASEMNSNNFLWPYYIALIKNDLGESGNSIKYIKTVVRLRPGYSQAWLRLGRAFFKVDSLNNAEHAFNRAVALEKLKMNRSDNEYAPADRAFPIKAYANLSLARCSILRGNNEAARVILENLINTQPIFGPAYRLLSQVYFSLGDSTKSNELAVRAADYDRYIPPTDLVYDKLVMQSRELSFLIKQIDNAIVSQNNNQAERLVKLLVQQFPENSEALMKLVIFLIDLHRYEETEPVIQQIVEMNLQDTEELFSIARQLLSRNQKEEAYKFISRIITIDPGFIPAHIEYIKILAHLEAYEFVNEHTLRVITNEPNNAKIRIEYGISLYMQKRNEEAKQQFRIALELEPNNEIAFLQLGTMFQQENDSLNAITYYRKSIAANSKNVNPWLQLGNYFVELGRWNDALDHFKKALEESPNDIDFLERYAWILATCPDDEIRDGQLALTYAKRLALMRKKRSDQDINCGIIFALAYGELGEFKKAIESTDRLIARAKQIRYEGSIPQLINLRELFESNKPYRL